MTQIYLRKWFKFQKLPRKPKGTLKWDTDLHKTCSKSSKDQYEIKQSIEESYKEHKEYTIIITVRAFFPCLKQKCSSIFLFKGKKIGERMAVEEHLRGGKTVQNARPSELNPWVVHTETEVDFWNSDSSYFLKLICKPLMKVDQHFIFHTWFSVWINTSIMQATLLIHTRSTMIWTKL